MAASLVLAGALVGLGATAASAATCPGWTGGQPPSPATASDLTGVAVVSVCDVWAVGTSRTSDKQIRTVIEHWTGGSSWTQVQSPNPGLGAALDAVTAVSPTDIWAVGTMAPANNAQPLIVHWDGTSWNQVQAPSLSDGGLLTAVMAVNAHDIWAVGQTLVSPVQTLILHYDGTGWTQIPSPSPGTSISELTGVSGRTASNAWAVGNYVDASNVTRTLILHWNGGAWTQVPSADPGSDNSLTAVTAVSGNDAWAVGAYTTQGQDHTLAEHWDGSAWTQVDTPPWDSPTRLAGVTATSAGNAWAVGSAGAGTQHNPVTLHWDGTSWSAVPRLAAGPDSLLFAVAASSPGNVWAVGQQAAQNFAAPLQGMPGFQAAANMRGGTLYEAGLVNGTTSQSIAAGTTPAVALNTSGGSKVAWTGANGHLFLIDQAGQRTDTGKTTAAGTTPAITALSGGGYQTVFVNAADGQLWQVTPDGAVTRIGPGYTPAPGTSPAIAAIAANTSGGYQIAAHGANTDDLWTISTDGTGTTGTDTGLKVAAGTSPAIAIDLRNAASEIAFAAAGTGDLTTIDTFGLIADTGVVLTPGTSPGLAARGPLLAITTRVPFVTGSRQADAEDTIHAAGLTVGPIPPDNTCKDTAGTVTEQDPGAGQLVPTGTPVTLHISSGVDGHGKKCIIS